jgi:hypothetical protein
MNASAKPYWHYVGELFGAFSKVYRLSQGLQEEYSDSCLLYSPMKKGPRISPRARFSDLSDRL